MPTPADFDTLNNKWSFSRHCLAQGVACPESWLFSGVRELRRWIVARRLPLPLIAKPLDWDGGHGVCLLPAEGWDKALGGIDYAPMIVQRWIDGDDIGAAAFCHEGHVASFLAHRYERGVYEAFPDPAIRDAIERILKPLATSGVFNFDMRRDAQGRVYFLECNPRFFFKIALAMEAGFNFVQCGLGRMSASAPSDTVTVRRPAAAILRAATTARLSKRDTAHWAHLWADPLPYLREMLGIDWDE
jgi:biotin carboxylase